LRNDPTSCLRKDCTQMLDVYVGSFFNVEIWPNKTCWRGVSFWILGNDPNNCHWKKKFHIGSFFNVEY
jgi:hypothetical protein